MDDRTKKRVRGFTAHGVSFPREREPSEENLQGECAFCGRDRFYVNLENLLWDCKVCGRNGNFPAFLVQIQERNEQAFGHDEQRRLARAKGLPLAAVIGRGIGFDGTQFTWLVRDLDGKAKDLRRYKLRRKVMATSGGTLGLLNHEKLAAADARTPVYLCEGESDGWALEWLLEVIGEPGIVVILPGATVFKQDWVPSFDGLHVQCFYDNDEAGARGEMLCMERLTGVAADVRYIEWPAAVPEGFDLKDWIHHGAVTLRTPRACWFHLQKLALPEPRRAAQERDHQRGGAVGPEEPARTRMGGSSGPQQEDKGRRQPPIGHKALYRAFQRWLQMGSEDPLAVTFGTLLANRLDGDPLWLFLVAPPGGMKSELLMSLATSAKTYSCSSLTPHALVSGAAWMDGKDPSLLPRLDGKVLIVKDFTTTLAMHPSARDEIFGQLRDAYDGKFEKQFGNGIVRRYKSLFGVMAGVTPNIDAFSSLHQGLGERFLKYRMERSMAAEDEEERILRAISNINRETSMRSDLQEAAARFLDKEVTEAPKMNHDFEHRMVRLAMLVARMRGVVNRDRYNPMIVSSKASHEIGTRVGKQLTKLAMGVALYYDHKEVSDRAYRIAVQVGLASVPDKIEEVVRTLWEHTGDDEDDVLSTKEVEAKSGRLTRSTIFRCLQDLAMLDIVQQVGPGNKYEWRLAPKVRRLIEQSGAYVLAAPERAPRRKRKRRVVVRR